MKRILFDTNAYAAFKRGDPGAAEVVRLFAVAKGAVMVCGSKATSTLMPATVLDHVTPSMRIYHEESFGPVKPIVRVNGVDEAVRIANDTEYGLSAAVFGRDIARAWGQYCPPPAPKARPGYPPGGWTGFGPGGPPPPLP